LPELLFPKSNTENYIFNTTPSCFCNKTAQKG